MTSQPQLRVVSTGDAPPPLLPPEIDLGDLKEVLLNIQWLCDSRFAFTASPEEFGAAVRLHARSFHEVPAATLPEDEAELAFLAGFGRDLPGWRRVKDRALEGWVLCADERYYRRDMAIKALDIWIKTLATRRKSAAGVAKRKRIEFNPERFDRPLSTAVDALYALDPHAPVLRNYLNVEADIEPEAPRALTPGSTSGQTPGSTKGNEPKGTESNPVYINPRYPQLQENLSQEGPSEGRDQNPGQIEPDPSEPEPSGPWPEDGVGLFFACFPNAVDEEGAKAAYIAARETSGISFKALLDAVDRYRRFKPPRQEWMKPANWLKNRRWTDRWPEPLVPPAPARSSDANVARATQIFVARDSPEWRAWQAHAAMTGRAKYPDSYREGTQHGWLFPARWPPGHSPP